MRTLILAALTLVTAGGAARADDVWPDPTGAFTLAINNRAWKTVPADSPGVMLQLEPRYSAGFSCDVQQQPLSAGSENQPQAQLNVMIDAITQAQFQAEMTGEAVDTFAVAREGGISVIRATSHGGDDEDGDAFVRTSSVFIAKGTGPAATSRVACVARKSVSAADQALMDKWLASLAFTPQR